MLFGSLLFTGIAGERVRSIRTLNRQRPVLRSQARVGAEKNSEYRRAWQSVHARWPASVETLGPSTAWPFLQEQWQIMKIRIIDQMLMYYYALLM